MAWLGPDGTLAGETGHVVIGGSSAGDPDGRDGFSYYWSGSEPYTIDPYYGDVTQYEDITTLTEGKTFKAVWMAAPIIWHSMGGTWNVGTGGEQNAHDPVKTGQPYDGSAGVTPEHYLSNTSAGWYYVHRP